MVACLFIYLFSLGAGTYLCAESLHDCSLPADTGLDPPLSLYREVIITDVPFPAANCLTVADFLCGWILPSPFGFHSCELYGTEYSSLFLMTHASGCFTVCFFWLWSLHEACLRVGRLRSLRGTVAETTSVISVGLLLKMEIIVIQSKKCLSIDIHLDPENACSS